MKKIKTLFERDFTNNGQIIDKYAEGTEWVVNGEGVATRKYDGTSVLIRGNRMYKRYELKAGKVAPDNFEPVDNDPETGKVMGWLPVIKDAPEDKWHVQALPEQNPDSAELEDGTYELLGPKVQGNPENVENHYLQKHEDAEVYEDVPVTFNGLREWLDEKDIEGIVWHHPDGRMVKIKKKDFRLKRVYNA